MEKLLAMAAQRGCTAEVFSRIEETHAVSFRTGTLHDIDSSLRAGLSLRLIRDGQLGYAYTKNLRDRDELLEQALAALRGGVSAPYEFPRTGGLPEPASYDPAIEQAGSTDIVDECARVSAAISARSRGEVHVDAETQVLTTRIANTAGTDVTARSSEFGIRARCVFPGSAAGISRTFEQRSLAPMPDGLIDEIVTQYAAAEREVTPRGGNMQVMFMPSSMVTLIWRIQSGTNAKSVFDKISPLADRQGEQIWDAALSIYDDPTDERFPGARPFDDEGVPCTRFPLVEQGVLQGFYNDLNYAAKLEHRPTGHGFRTSMWGGDPTTLKPSPNLAHLYIAPGTSSLDSMVAKIDRGIILEGALGAHSGNIPNGDFSVGVCPGLYVEKGAIVGRVKDAMVAGNIYETLKHVVAVGDRLYPAFMGHFPALLCDNVSVATRG